MDYTLQVTGGIRLEGQEPVVVIGPNGSGKTRETRRLETQVPIEFINALRNTRVATELPVVAVDNARNNFNNQRSQARNNYWEPTNEFDNMLSQLLAQQSTAAMDFARRFRKDSATAGEPEETTLTRVERLWETVFPGRELIWRDWKPVIKNRSTGTEIEYSGNYMSDGEKAALYLAGRVFSAEPGVLVVDEPETHFHSLLAVRLWNALEEARPDIRFVYVTHDLTFALSRQNAHFVLASPTEGLRSVELESTLPSDITEALLGSASLSFYASRVVFCEGTVTSLDSQIYGAWFNGPDTVVRPVGDCQRVIRCVEALSNLAIASALTSVGVVDRDHYSDAFVSSLPNGVHVLGVHEVESLLCLPDLVVAVCSHVGQSFDAASYRDSLASSVSDAQKHQVAVERWKSRVEPHLVALVADAQKRATNIPDLIAELPSVFDHTKWSFSPENFLTEENDRVNSVLPSGSVEEILKLVPGKHLLHVAARQADMNPAQYTKLVLEALDAKSDALGPLGEKIAAALSPHLPARQVPPRATIATL